jgi:arylsulfatase
MNKTLWLICVISGYAIIALGLGCSRTGNDSKPRNFIIILTDDQGYQDLGCFGSPDIQTPNVDQMAREGMVFTDFYAQPLCAPSRTALLTGCYPIRVAEYGNLKRKFPYVHKNEILLSRMLQDAGYATGMIGKVDITQREKGYKPELNPVRRGFDYWYGVIGANDFIKTKRVYQNEAIIHDSMPLEMLTQHYTQQALDFIRHHNEQPFFLYIAHTMPHIDLAVSGKFRGKSGRGLYGDVIGELDWSTGQIIELLKELELDKGTIVVFTSDNGPYFHQQAVENGHAGSALPLRGSKGTTWEGGMRVPCVMWGPGFIPEGAVCKEMCTIMDLLPTFIKMADARLPGDRVIDGRDISALMAAKKGAKTPYEAFYYYMECELEAVRSGPWKLVLPREHVRDRPWLERSTNYQKFVPGVFDGVPELQLYNLEQDMGEQYNLAAGHPEVVEQMMKLVEETYAELGNYDRIGKGVRFFEEGAKWPNLEAWCKQ